MFHLCFHYTGLLGIGTVSSISARLSTGPGLLGSVSHVESMELALAQEAAQSWANFGIVLGRQRSKLEGEGEDGMPLVVAQIERGSPADKCGVLQPGDRILCINEWHTAEGSLHEAQHLLRALSLSGTRSSTLLVEFNLIEPVLPPSPGTLFIVRLAKRGNCLGIVCRSERKGAQKGEPLVISHIRVGSVAHRCGSIQVGDRVHSIDDIPLDACTVEEAMRLLQRSAQVVKLCIAKGGDQEQDLLDGGPQSVIYTVELARRGQPLGITIASAGSILDPIVISQLAPGGLAERTGALHVGDRILAVNGDTLEGKKVGQVTLMLQQCPDPVSLKLCRQMAILQEPFPHWRIPSSLAISSDPNASGIAGADGRKTPLKSLDSAMDSLEESPPSDGQQARHGTLKSMAHLRPSLCNNFHQADGISGGSSDPYSAGAGWDSGLSSAAATESQGGGGHQHARGTAQEKCCACQLGSDPSCSSNSPQSSAGSSSASGARKEEKEEWMRILEALETVGEEEMLRKLEESILTGQASNYVPPARTEHGQKNRQCHLLPSECGVLSKRFIPGCTANYSSALPNSFATQTANSTVRPSLLKKPAPMSPKPVRRSELAPQGQQQDVGTSKGEGGGRESQPGTPTPGLRRNGGFISAELPPPMPSPRAPSVPASFPVLASTFVPSENTSSSTSSIPFISSPVEKEPGCGEGGGPEEGQGEEDKFDELSEVFSVQLNRCPLTKSFGFSICDGPIGEEGGEAREEGEQRAQQPIGIYIRSVIREGPAEKSGRIRPGDRILQINARSIQFLTCDVVLPLLSTEKVDLLLLRRRQGRVARI